MLCGLSVAAPLVLHFSDAVVSDGLWRCWMVAAFHFFAKEKLLFGHSSMKPRLVDICSDGCPFGSFPHLHTASLELKVTIGFLVTSLTKALLP